MSKVNIEHYIAEGAAKLVSGELIINSNSTFVIDETRQTSPMLAEVKTVRFPGTLLTLLLPEENKIEELIVTRDNVQVRIRNAEPNLKISTRGRVKLAHSSVKGSKELIHREFGGK